MRSMRRRLIQYAGPVLLISLLLAPIVASGHIHTAHSSTQPCAICVVTHHTPVAGASPVAAEPAAPLILSVERVVATRPAAPAHRSACSRGPPSSFLAQRA